MRDPAMYAVLRKRDAAWETWESGTARAASAAEGAQPMKPLVADTGRTIDVTAGTAIPRWTAPSCRPAGRWSSPRPRALPARPPPRPPPRRTRRRMRSRGCRPPRGGRSCRFDRCDKTRCHNSSFRTSAFAISRGRATTSSVGLRITHGSRHSLGSVLRWIRIVHGAPPPKKSAFSRAMLT